MAKILVSDDDPQVLRLVGYILEKAGHDAVCTAKADEVAELACHSPFDVIILDVMMPTSGFEVLNRLRNNPVTASVPILFLSGANSAIDRIRGLREGADDYVTKPFESEELLLRLDRLIAWKHRSEPAEEDSEHHLGRYEVRGVIGQGTMGTVFRGWDPRLERAVALKTIRFDAATVDSRRQELLERLRQEAVTVAQFNHPNIVAVYDMGNTGNSAYIAMELVEGISLATYLAESGPPPADQFVPLAAGMARGLAAAHARAVIHRDVKPNNVLLGRDGGIKMSDFGVAAVMSRAGADASRLYGTPGYVPPEALREEPYTQAGDLFGLGATLYQTLAGRHPLIGETLRQTIDNTLEGRIAPLDGQCGGVPDEIVEAVMALLALDPAGRPTADQVATLCERTATARHFEWTTAP